MKPIVLAESVESAEVVQHHGTLLEHVSDHDSIQSKIAEAGLAI